MRCRKSTTISWNCLHPCGLSRLVWSLPKFKSLTSARGELAFAFWGNCSSQSDSRLCKEGPTCSWFQLATHTWGCFDSMAFTTVREYSSFTKILKRGLLPAQMLKQKDAKGVTCHQMMQQTLGEPAGCSLSASQSRIAFCLIWQSLLQSTKSNVRWVLWCFQSEMPRKTLRLRTFVWPQAFRHRLGKQGWHLVMLQSQWLPDLNPGAALQDIRGTCFLSQTEDS